MYPAHACYDPTVHGDVLSRLNLFRFIREHLYHSGVGPGYYAEFGVFNGDSMADAHSALRGVVDHYVGFDTFSGLPTLSSEDKASMALMPHWRAGTVKGATRDRVLAHLQARGLPPDRLMLCEGEFRDVLPAFDLELLRERGECHVCLVDCDLYSSSVEVFAFLEKIVVEGTWLLLDDFWCYRGSPRHGQRRAFEEWLGSSRFGVSEWGGFRGWGKAFLVYRKGV